MPIGPYIDFPSKTSFKTPWFPNQYTRAIAARIEGLSSGIKAINLKNPLKGIHVRVSAYENKKANITTITVELIATNKLLYSDWNNAGSWRYKL